MWRENPASLAKSLQEVNSEGQYLHVRAEGFNPKKRSGIAVRVETEVGT